MFLDLPDHQHLRRGGLFGWLLMCMCCLVGPAVYIRHPNGHDLGRVLKKVIFHLHPSFLNATRGRLWHVIHSGVRLPAVLLPLSGRVAELMASG